MKMLFPPRARALLSIVACLGCGSALGYESDVHFGLTKYLALQAGYDPGQAEAIAIGNQLVDSGDMQFIALGFDYACLASDAELAGEAAAHHFPTAGRVPGAPDARAVVAGSDAASKAARDVLKTQPSQSGFMLYHLGEAVHALQDSFAHQGTPDVPTGEPVFTCEANLAWAHPRARGGFDSHRADLTAAWQADTIAMAQATYDVLTRYPAIANVTRQAKPWEQIRPLLDGFARASTKEQKRAWFAAQGITDVAFLSGTTLKDGAKPFDIARPRGRVPRLPAFESKQHRTDSGLAAFFDRFFADWLTKDDFDAIAAANAAPADHARASKAERASRPLDKAELAARLRLWRVRDHAAVADLVHARGPLDARQLASVRQLAKSPAALMHYGRAEDAVIPVVTNDKDASPLLPFIVRSVSTSPAGNERAVAVIKLRHTPYDTIAVSAERIAGQWRVIGIAGMVDH